MRTWEQFMEAKARGEGGQEGMFFRKGEQPRMPVSARIPGERLTLPALKTPDHYKHIADKYGHVDRPESGVQFTPTHRSKANPSVTIMADPPENGVVKYIIKYSGNDIGTGREPEALFSQNWEPLVVPGNN